MNSSKGVGRSFPLAVILAFVAVGAEAQGVTEPAVTPLQTPLAIDSPAVTQGSGAFSSALRDEIAVLGPKQRAAVERFYAANGYTPFWTAAGGGNLTGLIDALDLADSRGLPYLRYSPDALKLLANSSAPEDLPVLELAATRSYLQYAGDLTAGFLKPSAIDEEIAITPRRMSDATLLERLGSGSSVSVVLAGLEPADPDYRALVNEADRLTGLINSNPWGPQVADGPTLHQGDTGPRVMALRNRLDLLGYGTEVVSANPAFYDPALVAQVKLFQGDHGLVDDGAAGRRTLENVNASVEERLEQVLVNLERMRWMNHDLGNRRIEVNIPDFTATLYQDDQTLWHSRVVVGKANDTRTPEFSDEMTYMVVNPTWHIPDSIATRSYLPKLRKDPTILERSNMSLFTRSGVKINPRLVDFSQYTAANFPFRVKQNPSLDNALGRVKFMFPNQYAIYLHDTPARSYFAKDARAFSNGCVRLEQPVELAEILMNGQYDSPASTFDGWLAAKSERHVNLSQKVRVHLLYRTVWAEPDGEIRYRSDIYGRDTKVFNAMESAGVRIRAANG